MAEHIQVLNEPQQLWGSNKAKLVCYSSLEVNHYSKQLKRLLKTKGLTNFLDIKFKNEVSDVWPYSRLIGVFTEPAHEQVPFYLREYWTEHIKPEIERFIAEHSSDEGDADWKIIDICGHSLIAKEILKIGGFTIYITPTFENDDPSLLQEIENDRVKILKPETLGSILNSTKQYHLRHHFYQPGVQTEIRLREIKAEKVFFAMVRRDGDEASYIVKFDHPKMIERERDNYRRVREALKNQEALKHIYKVQSRRPIKFSDSDILDMVVSEAIMPLFSPIDLPLRAQWKKLENDDDVLRFYESVAHVLDVLAAIAISHKKLQFREETSVEAFYKLFFRKLNGFTLFKDFREVPELFPPLLGGDDKSRIKYSIRRIKVDATSSSSDLQLAIQLQPKRRERVLIRFQNFSQGSAWQSTIARTKLLSSSEVSIDPDLLDTKGKIWSNAIDKLTSLIECSDIANQDELPIPASGQRLRNPIKFFIEVKAGNVQSFNFGEFKWIESLIHFDLHLDNILIHNQQLESSNNHGKGSTLIDLASMEMGPIDYDYARMEARLVLDMASTLRSANQESAKEIVRIIGFHDAIKRKHLKKGYGEFKKVFTFVKKLREKRTDIVAKINTEGHITGIVFPEEKKTLELCLLFEYLSELFERASAKSYSDVQLLWSFISAAYYLRELDANS